MIQEKLREEFSDKDIRTIIDILDNNPSLYIRQLEDNKLILITPTGKALACTESSYTSMLKNIPTFSTTIYVMDADTIGKEYGAIEWEK